MNEYTAPRAPPDHTLGTDPRTKTVRTASSIGPRGTAQGSPGNAFSSPSRSIISHSLFIATPRGEPHPRSSHSAPLPCRSQSISLPLPSSCAIRRTARSSTSPLPRLRLTPSPGSFSTLRPRFHPASYGSGSDSDPDSSTAVAPVARSLATATAAALAVVALRRVVESRDQPSRARPSQPPKRLLRGCEADCRRCVRRAA